VSGEEQGERVTFEEARGALLPPGTGALADAVWRQEAPLGSLPGDPASPADPFSPGAVADTGTAEMFWGLQRAGIPLASVERILGAMFAAYAMMDKAAAE
jgi:hypothetical protein